MRKGIVAVCVAIVIVGISYLNSISTSDQIEIEQNQPMADENIAEWMRKITELANCTSQNISYTWNTPISDSTDYEFFQAIFTFKSESIKIAINDAYALATSVQENASLGLSPSMIIVNTTINEKELSITMLTSALPEKSKFEYQILKKWEDNSSQDSIVIV